MSMLMIMNFGELLLAFDCFPLLRVMVNFGLGPVGVSHLVSVE